MYNGIGLSTPRGSGTNGYVQRNSANVARPHGDYAQQEALKARHDAARSGGHFDPDNLPKSLVARQANRELLEHQRKRIVEVKCAELEAQLEDDGYA